MKCNKNGIEYTSRTALKIILWLIALFMPGFYLTDMIHAGEIYKWVDKRGKIYFSEFPPNDDATRVEVRKPNTIDRLEIVIPINDLESGKESSIPSHEFKSYYEDEKLKFQYKTIAGIRVNPTREYYSWGDLKRKIVYKNNLLDAPIKIKNILTLNRISVIEEFLDSITFEISYELYQRTNRSSFFIQIDYYKLTTKSVKLKPGKNSIKFTSTLRVKTTESFDTDDLILRFYNHNRGSWSTVGRVKFVKIWSPGG